MQINQYQILDRSVSKTPPPKMKGNYDKAFLGSGDNMKEAFFDALSQIEEKGFDISLIEYSPAAEHFKNENAENMWTVEKFVENMDELPDDDSNYLYYVTVRFSLKEDEEFAAA